MNMTTSPATFAVVARLIRQAAMSPRTGFKLHAFGDFNLPGYSNVAFDCDLYAYGEVLAVHLAAPLQGANEHRDHIATLTVNVPDHSLPPGCFFAKCYGENTFLRDPLLSQGWFEDTGVRVPTGFTQVEVWRVTQKFCDNFIAAHQSELSFLQEAAIV